jgi:thiol reductant ABC exporter CydD subunit
MAIVEKRMRTQPIATDGIEAGELAAVAVQGIEGLEGYFARYLPQAVLATVVPVLIVVWVAVVDPISALIMLLTLPLVPVFMWLIGTYTEERTRDRWEALRDLSTHFLDVVRGLPTLRALGLAQSEAERMQVVSERYRRTTMETLRVSFLSGSVLELAATLGVALIAVDAGLRMVAGHLDLEAGLTVLILAPELYLPFRRLGAEYHASADGLAVAEQMFALLDAPTATSGGGLAVAPTPATAAIRFETVSFAYPSRSTPVLDELDLEISPGETVALVGESGAGKSTIGGLLLGLLEPTGGRICIGDCDLSRCNRAEWRKQVAWVPQHPTLLRSTVEENLRLGDANASAARVRRAAALAGADEFIALLPTGYDTLVGDGGRPLSPGERRRIGLARAFLRDAPLVILDEPTAALDPVSVSVVSSAVRRMQDGRTMLLIAHRPELVRYADRTVRLAHGAVMPEALPRAA